MTTWAVLASGPSMSQGLADHLRGKCLVVAVSDVYRLAPWADALVSHDKVWWEQHPEAMKFQGRKFCGRNYPGTEQLSSEGFFAGGCNSGLQGMRVAQMLGANRILLLGFDLSAERGHHFFGKHPKPLRNTTPHRFKCHIAQFRKWKGCPVINCTPGSALKQFPFMTIQESLLGVAA